MAAKSAELLKNAVISNPKAKHTATVSPAADQSKWLHIFVTAGHLLTRSWGHRVSSVVLLIASYFQVLN